MQEPRSRPRTASPGGRYIHDVRAVYSRTSQHVNPLALQRNAYYQQGIYSAMYLMQMLDDPETRRIVVDSKQAAQFVETNGMPPAERYRLPFDQMYIEFTTPIEISEQEPSGARVFDDQHIALVVGQLPLEGGLDILPPDLVRITMLLRSTERSVETGDYDWADRSFYFDILTGRAMSHPNTLTTANAQGAPSYLDHADVSVFPEGALGGIDPNLGWVATRTEGPGRGWWERLIGDYGQFVAWLLTYMTAKGIVIVEESLTRQQRRAMARMKHRPSPWHVVTVDPTFYRDVENGEGTGSKHSYRYDVRGHLRFGRHPRKDGTYTERVEWVRPHQRGLASAVYVPKTYLYDAKSPEVRDAESGWAVHP